MECSCHKWRSLSILVSCSRGREGWNGRLTDGSVQLPVYVPVCRSEEGEELQGEALDLPVNLRSYGHELWVMTERTRSQIQAAKMSFLRRVAGCSLRDSMRSSVTREDLRVEPLLLDIERSQLRWLGHLFRMPLGRLPGEVFQARPTRRRPRERPRTRWRYYVSRLAWERLGIPPEEQENVSREREVWASLLRLLPP